MTTTETAKVGPRQGDILFVPADIPMDSKPLQSNGRGYVLAEGEATGHAHTIEARTDIELFAHAGVLYVRNAASVEVRHQEHASVTLPPGTHSVIRQKVWDSANAARIVQD